MALTLENDSLRIIVEPDAGGKLTSLQSLRSGREWLWKNPHIATQPQAYGVSYIEKLDSGGWDEIFPSVGPCTPEGWQVPDHGDLVSLPWEVLATSAQKLVMAVTTRFAECRFTRTLVLNGSELQVTYRLENRGAEAVPYLWCAHPLIAIAPGMRIELPAGGAMRLDGGVNVPSGESFTWPDLPGLGAVDVIPDPHAAAFAPFAAKMFTAAGAVDRIAVRTADGKEALHLAWNRDDAPFLGLWLNCRGWSGCGSPPYFNLGVEPATAPFDSLEDALKDGSGRWIEAGASMEWKMTLSVQG